MEIQQTKTMFSQRKNKKNKTKQIICVVEICLKRSRKKFTLKAYIWNTNIYIQFICQGNILFVQLIVYVKHNRNRNALLKQYISLIESNLLQLLDGVFQLMLQCLWLMTIFVKSWEASFSWKSGEPLFFKSTFWSVVDTASCKVQLSANSKSHSKSIK